MAYLKVKPVLSNEFKISPELNDSWSRHAPGQIVGLYLYHSYFLKAE